MGENEFGFLNKLPLQAAVQLLENGRSEKPQPDEDQILNYLQNGTQVVAVAGIVRDLLSKNCEVVGPPHEYSDGVWSWTSDMIHYVRRYHFRVPDAFVSHMRASNWIPKVPREDMTTTLKRWQL